MMCVDEIGLYAQTLDNIPCLNVQIRSAYIDHLKRDRSFTLHPNSDSETWNRRSLWFIVIAKHMRQVLILDPVTKTVFWE